MRVCVRTAAIGCTAAVGVERTIRAERRPVFNASPRRSTAGCGRTTCQSDGCRPSSRLHGSHPGLPGPGGKTQGAACRFCWVQLSQGDRSFQLRWAKAFVSLTRVMPVAAICHFTWSTAQTANLLKCFLAPLVKSSLRAVLVWNMRHSLKWRKIHKNPLFLYFRVV